MSDNISNSFIDNNIYVLFNEWGYKKEMTVYKCFYDDSLFIKVIGITESKHDLPISLKDLSFYRNIYIKGIKTLLMFFNGSIVYYGFLDDLEIEEDGDTAYINGESMKEIDFNNRLDG